MAATQPAPLMLLISAPSGAGKTTLCRNLLDANPNLRRAITCTTRDPRPGETDGVDYHFMDAQTFLRRVESGHFLEHATVHGNSYGTLRQEVTRKLEEGHDVLLNVDVQGAASIRRAAEKDPLLQAALVTLFLMAASMEILETRLRNRASDSDEVIDRRLSAARQEAAQWRHFDYLLVSGTLEEDARRAQAILDAEHLRARRATAPQW
jgi:guanylate kinase